MSCYNRYDKAFLPSFACWVEFVDWTVRSCRSGRSFYFENYLKELENYLKGLVFLPGKYIKLVIHMKQVFYTFAVIFQVLWNFLCN
uniref:Uncharacterized protein n=1 Tax=Caudovirales sp. ctkvU4 TaxID=2826783 RepID=A0A8S5QQJ2_9CAUD|nr:MAG TPA: hypothetical protein [Caudovirales sp. ctkvU4]